MLNRTLALVLLVVTAAMTWTPARADFAEGIAAYEAGNFGAAYEAWLPLAEDGDSAAQLSMGILYENGRGVERDFEAAIMWYTRAAEAGNPGAQFNLGNMYHEGIGVPADSARAVIWWTLAAEKGLPGAMLNLGIAYHLGDGVTHDPARAFELFRGAAEAGVPAAQFSAGYAYELGLGTEQNLHEARRLYTLAAEGGVPQAGERLIAMEVIDVEPLAAETPVEEVAVVGEESVVAAVLPEVDIAEVAAVESVDNAAVPKGNGFAYIQLAAFLTESRAEVAWRELTSRHPDLLADLPHRIRKMTTSSEPGTVYGLQVGPMPAADEARAICNALRSRNAECFLTGL